MGQDGALSYTGSGLFHLKISTFMGNKQTSILPECQLLLVMSELRMLAWLWILNGLCLPDFTPYFKTSARLDQPSSRGRL
jgi:hypothetical protein